MHLQEVDLPTKIMMWLALRQYLKIYIHKCSINHSKNLINLGLYKKNKKIDARHQEQHVYTSSICDIILKKKNYKLGIEKVVEAKAHKCII